MAIDDELDDPTLILAGIGRKARRQVDEFVEKLFDRHMVAEQAHEIAQALSDGRWTHDFPIDVEQVQKFGLPVSTDLPKEVRALMGLYPQPGGRQPSVEYVPAPAPSPDGQAQRRWAPSPRHPARPAGS
jgi:ClpP class serine protease